MRNTLIVFGAAMLLAQVFTVQAQPIERPQAERSHWSAGGERHPLRMLRGLDLTDEQKQQLQDLRERQQQHRMANRDSVKEAHQWLKRSTEQLLSLPEFDATLAAEIAARKAELLKTREQEKLKVQFELQQVLSAEQLAKLKAKHKAKHKHRFVTPKG